MYNLAGGPSCKKVRLLWLSNLRPIWKDNNADNLDRHKKVRQFRQLEDKTNALTIWKRGGGGGGSGQKRQLVWNQVAAFQWIRLAQQSLRCTDEIIFFWKLPSQIFSSFLHIYVCICLPIAGHVAMCNINWIVLWTIFGKLKCNSIFQQRRIKRWNCIQDRIAS